MGVAHARLGLPPALFVFGDARGLLDDGAQFLGACLDEAGDHALFDDGVAARPQAGAQEQVGDVATATAGAVEEVLGLAVAVHHPLHRDLGVAGVGAAEAPVGVVEHQFHTRLRDGLAAGRAIEHHVGHGLAAQVLCRALPHHPAHRVDDVGLARSVGAYHPHQVALQAQGGGVHEGLEAGEFDSAEAHGIQRVG